MSQKDFYTSLGVDEKADAATIKRAYRRLAKENHPDTRPGDQAAEARFKEISEAYKILSDPAKRKKYDQLRKFGYGGRGISGNGFSQQGFDFDFTDLFNSRERNRRQPNADFNLDDILGFGGLGDMFGQIFEKNNHSNSTGTPKRRLDICKTVSVPFETAVMGGKTVFTVPEKNGQQFSINIPPGTEDGKKLRLSGHGFQDARGAQGDLIVTAKVIEHRFFSLQGVDIYCEIPLKKNMADIGTVIRVKTIYGSTVELKIPGGTQNEKTFRLKGLGVKSKNKTGDQFVKIRLQ